MPAWLRLKLDLNKCSQKYGLPLHLAIKNHDFKVARMILLHGSKSDRVIFDINAKDHDGNNALHVVMSHFGYDNRESAQIAVLLIRMGVDINTLNNHELSPAHVAIKNY